MRGQQNELSLTEQQCRLLRLVAAGVSSSKELSRETGLKPSSIDTYLQSAARALEADGRHHAAKRFIQIEQENSQPPSQLRTDPLEISPKWRLPWLVRPLTWFMAGLPIGGREHSFSWPRIAAEIFRVAVLGIAGLTFLVLLVLGFMRTFG